MASRKHDAESQITYWQLNLKALEAKEAAQIAFRDSLVISRDQFAKAALELPTLIGSGFSGYYLVYLRLLTFAIQFPVALVDIYVMLLSDYRFAY